jgi:two-component system, NarL family, sensor kinase
LKNARRQHCPGTAPSHELIELRSRLAEAEETLRAIRGGEVDAVMAAGKNGRQVFTLEGAGHAYRVLIESMNEGALTLTFDKTMLYANQCFARMVKCPLEQVIGSSFRRFLSAEDRAILRPLMRRPRQSGSKILVLLNACDGSQMPAQISIRPLAKNGSKRANIGMVVTDMTEARRNEENLRVLTHRVVQVQEIERERVALELHDTITQMLCGVLVRSQVLVNKLPLRNKPAKAEARRLHALIGQTVEEVERISHNLRPSVLDHLGLVAGLHDTSKEFAARTGVPVKMVCVQLNPRLAADTELALYRILQESLKNVEKHSRARHVTVDLTKERDIVQMAVHDDGIGFDPEHQPARRNGKGGFGLLGMRERAIAVGGTLKVESKRRAGTEIEVRIPLPPSAKRAAGLASKLSPAD